MSSLDFSSTLRWANTRLLALAQAETMWTRAFLPASRVPQSVFAIDGYHFARSQFGNRRNPRHEALFHLLRVQRRKHPVKRIVRRNARRKPQKRLQPLALILAVIRNVVPALGPASVPPQWQSEESLPADVPGSVRSEDRVTQQNTSGDCPFPLLTYFLLHAYSKLGTFICVGPARKTS